jgi:hypothetical protein
MERLIRNVCNELVDYTVSHIRIQQSFKDSSSRFAPYFTISKNRHLDSPFAGFNKYTYLRSKHGREGERERERGRERKKERKWEVEQQMKGSNREMREGGAWRITLLEVSQSSPHSPSDRSNKNCKFNVTEA